MGWKTIALDQKQKQKQKQSKFWINVNTTKDCEGKLIQELPL